MAAIIGILVQAGIAEVVPPSAKPWIAVIVAIGTAMGVYQVRNETLARSERDTAAPR